MLDFFFKILCKRVSFKTHRKLSAQYSRSVSGLFELLVLQGTHVADVTSGRVAVVSQHIILVLKVKKISLNQKGLHGIFYLWKAKNSSKKIALSAPREAANLQIESTDNAC